MEFDPSWLVSFPLFFALGWIAARLDLKKLLSESRTLPRSYFQGLNFLLDEQPDKALASLSDMAHHADIHAVELNFALGRLFRRQGELERAIRIHAALLERADLETAQQHWVWYELGQDYLKAGLLDRAEQQFQRLLSTPQATVAQEALLQLYQIQQAWPQAIDMANALQSTGASYQTHIAHFYCEIASQALLQQAWSEAEKMLQAALHVQPNSARVHGLQGQCAQAQGQYAAAITAWEYVAEQTPHYRHWVVAELWSAYQAQHQVTQGLTRLQQWAQQETSQEVLAVAYQATQQQLGARAAYEWLQQQLRVRPSLLGLSWLLAEQALEASGQRQQDLAQISQLLVLQAQQRTAYACGECGFQARQFYWRCPACGAWESLQAHQAV